MIRLTTALLLFLTACASSAGPRVRYANASPAQLQAAEAEPVVWYEFQPGDRLPLLFAFLGMAEAGSDSLEMVVKRPFWIVVHEDGRVMFSFDNERQQANPFSRWGLIVGDGERRGTLGLLMYVGPRNEAPAALSGP